MNKKILAVPMAALLALVAAGPASAATTDVADFHLTVNTAKIVVDGLLPDGLEVPGSDPALAGKTINVDGVITKAGKVTIGPTGFDFPAVSLGEAVPIPGVNLDIVQTDTTTGTLTTGSASIPLHLGVKLVADLLPVGCLVKGLNFNFGTGNATVGATTLLGSAWNSSTGAITLTGTAAIPDVALISSTDCSIKSLLSGAGIAGKGVALKLSGSTTIGAKYLAPAKPTITGGTLSFSKGQGKVKVACAGTSSKARSCAGTLVLDVGANAGTPVNVSIAPGKSVSVPVALTAGQVTAIGSKTVAGSVSVVLDRGTVSASKSVSVKNRK